MPKLLVKGLTSLEWGTTRIRLHTSHRNGVPRYGIAKVTNKATGKSVLAVLLGHDDDTSIFMDYDIREELGVKKSGTLDFEVASAWLPMRLYWYLTIKDPLIRIPAWLAFWSVLLGIAGIISGVFG